MKIFNSLDVQLKVQDYGTSWHMIMRGRPLEVEWLFNAMFNFGATNEPHYTWNHCETEAYFFSTKARMTKFFTELYRNRYVMQGGMTEEDAVTAAQFTAVQAVESLFANDREVRKEYKASVLEGESYGMGQIRAENPDADGKDLILERAFAPVESEGIKTPTIEDEIGEMFSDLQS